MWHDEWTLRILAQRYHCRERDVAYHVAMQAALEGLKDDDDDAGPAEHQAS